MGRPVNKRFFGTGPGSQLKVRAKVGSNAEGDGYIVSQRSGNRFKVTVGANTGICKLVDKAEGSLGANEMIIRVMTDAGQVVNATKIYNRTVLANGTRQKWTFTANSSDGKVQIEDEAASNFYTITINGQPADATATQGNTAAFSVNASVSPSTTITYQWQKQESGAGAWSNVANATSSTYTTGSLTVAADNTDKYRVLVLATNADTVTSNAATLTVTL